MGTGLSGKECGKWAERSVSAWWNRWRACSEETWTAPMTWSQKQQQGRSGGSVNRGTEVDSYRSSQKRDEGVWDFRPICGEGREALRKREG